MFEPGDRVRQVRPDEPETDIPPHEECVVTSNWASAVTMRVRRISGEESLVDCSCFARIGERHE